MEKSSRNIQRSVLVYSIVGILIISVIVAAVSFFPLRSHMRHSQSEQLQVKLHFKIMAVEQFLAKSTDIAWQITSRTKIRNQLESYNNSKLDFDSLVTAGTRMLGDALKRSEDVVGISRLDKKDQLVISVGAAIPQEHWALPVKGTNEINLKLPVLIQDEPYMVIGAPIINNENEQVGTDLVLFSLEGMKSIVENYTGLGKTGETSVGHIDENNNLKLVFSPKRLYTRDTTVLSKDSPFYPAFHSAVNEQKGLDVVYVSRSSGKVSHTECVVAFAPISGSALGMIMKIDSDELFGPITAQLLKIAGVIAILIVIGVTGMVFLLRPISNKIILHASDLENTIKEQTEALQESDFRMKSIVNSAADGIITIDENGEINQFNNAAETIFLYEKDQIIGKNVSLLMPDKYAKESGADLDISSFVTEGEREIEGIKKDGKMFPLEIAISEVITKKGKEFTGIVRDIGPRKQAQEALIKEKEEQARLSARLEKMESQLVQSEKMASIGQLAAGVAHEINNPVGYINSNISSMRNYFEDFLKIVSAYERAEHSIKDKALVEQISKTKSDVDFDYLLEDIHELIKESLEGVTRVKKIVQDLKDFSHVDEQDWQVSDVHDGITSTLNIVNNEIKYKADVVTEFGDIPPIECIPSRINQVILNLLVNAAHAIESKGIITIKSGKDDEDNIWIDISDTGKGIAPQDIKRIFDPFFTTKPVGSGTGLGLSLSYGIIEGHHGEITVSSELGKGTTFRIVLPVHQNNREDEL